MNTVKITEAFAAATRRLLLLDYDGTLADIAPLPSQAAPTARTLAILASLCNLPRTTVVIVSGRDRQSLEDWLGHLPLVLSAEHGCAIKKPGHDWQEECDVATDWRKTALLILERYTAGMPGAFTEEKLSSIAWHYRRAHETQVRRQLPLLFAELRPLVAANDLGILQGNKVIEIKSGSFSKGTLAQTLIPDYPSDFILAAGDDTTDEDMFAAMPAQAVTIKIGPGDSMAAYRLPAPDDLLGLLAALS